MAENYISVPLAVLQEMISTIGDVIEKSTEMRRRFGALDDQLEKDALNFDNLGDELEKASKAGFSNTFAGLERSARITADAYATMRGAINSASHSNLAYSESLRRLKGALEDICEGR